MLNAKSQDAKATEVASTARTTTGTESRAMVLYSPHKLLVDFLMQTVKSAVVGATERVTFRAFTNTFAFSRILSATRWIICQRCRRNKCGNVHGKQCENSDELLHGNLQKTDTAPRQFSVLGIVYKSRATNTIRAIMSEKALYSVALLCMNDDTI